MLENFGGKFPLLRQRRFSQKALTDSRSRPIDLCGPEERLDESHADSIFMGKCIRAGRGPSVGTAWDEHGPDRAEQNVDIEPERPVADVVAV